MGKWGFTKYVVIREKFRFEAGVIVMGFTDSSGPINSGFVITDCEIARLT